MAPARITASLTIATPRKINVPRPPAPIAAAIVATPIVITVAVRIPAKITLSPSGNRTFNKIWDSVMPIASAASSTAGSRFVSPTTVFRKIGNSAYKTSAITAVLVPIPPRNGSGIKKPNSARLGIVCSTEAIPSAKLRVVLRFTRNMPSGTPSKIAITMDAITRNRWVSVASRISKRWIAKNSQRFMLAPRFPFRTKPQTPALPDDQFSKSPAAAHRRQSLLPPAKQSAIPASSPLASRASQIQSSTQAFSPNLRTLAVAPRASPDRGLQTAHPSTKLAGPLPARVPRPLSAADRRKAPAAFCAQIHRAPARQASSFLQLVQQSAPLPILPVPAPARRFPQRYSAETTLPPELHTQSPSSIELDPARLLPCLSEEFFPLLVLIIDLPASKASFFRSRFAREALPFRLHQFPT